MNARRATLSALARVGGISVREDGQVALAADADAPAVIDIRDPAAYRGIVQGGIGAAQAFIDGLWTSPDLAGLVRAAAVNLKTAETLEDGWRKWRRRAAQALRSASRRQTRADIAAHYDLGNDFFALFLDESRAYSCAVYPSPEATLEEAQQTKAARIGDKLELSATDHLLDLGCGWGAFTFYAAQRYDCRVTALTLSAAQHRYLTAEIKRRGLDGQITAALTDYRDFAPSARFSKLASVEMIEAVGARNFGVYFARIAELLAPGGRALVQAILIPDNRFAVAAREADFIRRYIFPGGALPSLSIIAQSASAAGLRLLGLEEIGDHYPPTLAEWRRRFLCAAPKAQALGFDDRFRRMWEYYLAYCEGSFAARAIGDAQIVFDAP